MGQVPQAFDILVLKIGHDHFQIFFALLFIVILAFGASRYAQYCIWDVLGLNLGWCLLLQLLQVLFHGMEMLR